MSDASKTFLPGVRVHVNYKQLGSYYAPGTVARRNLDGTYAIDYDDGEKEQNVDSKLIFPYGNHPQPNRGGGGGVGGGGVGGGGSAVGSAAREGGDPLEGMSGSVLCCLCLFMCGFSAALVAFVVFGIMFLVQDQDVCEHFSPLFVFGVVFFVAPWFFQSIAMCFAMIVLAATKTPAELAYETERSQAALASGIVAVQAGSSFRTPTFWFVIAFVLGIALYGLVIIYGGFTCDDMKGEPLYIWAQVRVCGMCCVRKAKLHRSREPVIIPVLPFYRWRPGILSPGSSWSLFHTS